METRGRKRLKKNGGRLTMEGHDSGVHRSTPFDAVQQSQSKPKKSRIMLDGTTMEHVNEIWDKLVILQDTLAKLPMHEGLKPLQNYSSLDELKSLGGDNLLTELAEANKEMRHNLNCVLPYVHTDGTCKSLNFDIQPLIAVIYGPTGCGKSQLLRNLISSRLINPPPETVFFIAPQVDMIPPQEMIAWQTQICEGNFGHGKGGIIIPKSGILMPEFVKMSYDELVAPQNYDVTHPENIFAKAASKGPIAIIMDECMEELGGHKGIAKFFHAFPSKLHDRFPKCTGYSVLVVLHNMNPRKDLGGNISNLKIQSKMHLISPKMHPSQLSRFINIYTKGLPLAISLLLKDIFNFHSQHSKFDWIIYNTCPPHESLQWMYLHPTEGLMPMYLDVQCFLYAILEKLNKVIMNRQRWSKYYHNNKRLLKYLFCLLHHLIVTTSPTIGIIRIMI
ncbi:IVa2 [red squirrel adenovirus 1]|uniref:Packaging protein 1 n=1 Tax=red squirrel adenovirus 1 TaxID=2773314 RepID=A0A220A482_9ADEN|nr:IVa2 [red squirrel adenovirus 1]ARE31904.1 IVa2 [red squirrel adenovirus 1]